MYSKIEKFLLDSKMNDEIFDSSLHKIQIHKEKYDDRFEIIYFKLYADSLMNQSRYDVGGYYDTKNHCLYEANHVISEKIPEDSIIKTSTFSKLGTDFLNKLKQYLIDYSFNHEKELKSIAQEKYNAKDDNRLNNFKKDVRRIFLSEKEAQILLPVAISDYDITKRKDYCDALIQYLDDSTKSIEKYSQILLEEYGEDFGLELLIYYDKIDYLKEITENKNNAFRDLYINKKILDSIKDLEVNNLNITIKYGENTLTFKFDYDEFKRDLLNGETECTRLYVRGYDTVNDFIRENTLEIYPASYKRRGFEFANIESISYGKKELYIKEDLNKELEVEEEIEPEI